MQNKFLKILIVLLAVAFIVPQITLAAWWNPITWGWLNNIFHFQQNAQKQNQQNKPPIVGGDKDAHGCIGSAGYSWCEAKKKCLRTWEESCSSATKNSCRVDSDCPPSMIDCHPNPGESCPVDKCINGQCKLTQQNFSVSCRVDSDCKTGYYCSKTSVKKGVQVDGLCISKGTPSPM